MRPMLLALTIIAVALAGCDNMANQPKRLPYEAYRGGRGAADSVPPPDTVARDEAPAPTPPVTPALLARGRQRFDIYCAPCHGRVGDGEGMIVERGFPKPPSYHIDRLRQTPSQHFYDVISNGYGAMYSYAARVEPADRWAIVAYIRALQASQDATLADVPENARRALQ
jgi:mono/diheme cytochrome c family protein